MLSAGDLRKRIAIERETKAADGMGGATSEWSEIGRLWAEVKPTGGREAVIAVVPTGIQGFRIRVRYSQFALGITHTDRIKWNGRTLALRTGFEDPTGDRDELVAYADAGVPA